MWSCVTSGRDVIRVSFATYATAEPPKLVAPAIVAISGPRGTWYGANGLGPKNVATTGMVAVGNVRIVWSRSLRKRRRVHFCRGLVCGLELVGGPDDERER